MQTPTAAAQSHPSSLFARSWRSSLWRAIGSTLSVFSIPLLLLAAISAAKLMTAAGLMSPTGWLKAAVDWQSGWVEGLRRALEPVRIHVPSIAIDGALFYIFVGNAVARSEANELLAVTLDDGAAWPMFKSAFAERRADYFFYSLPWLLRWFAIRLLWPLAAVYRFGTPWVVDGLGPDGDDISTSVLRRDMPDFVAQLTQAGAWTKQTVYDCRLILLTQLLIGLASSLALHAVAKLWV